MRGEPVGVFFRCPPVFDNFHDLSILYFDMLKAPKKKIVSLPWPELDRVELSAAWIEGTDPIRFAVERRHDGVLRGRWEFQYIEKNEWECTRAGAEYLRDERARPPKPNPRETDDSRIPSDIALKAREFLTAETKLKPRTSIAQ